MIAGGGAWLALPLAQRFGFRSSRYSGFTWTVCSGSLCDREIACSRFPTQFSLYVQGDWHSFIRGCHSFVHSLWSLLLSVLLSLLLLITNIWPATWATFFLYCFCCYCCCVDTSVSSARSFFWCCCSFCLISDFSPLLQLCHESWNTVAAYFTSKLILCSAVCYLTSPMILAMVLLIVLFCSAKQKVNTKHLYDIYTMTAQCLRCWSKIV